MPEMIDTRRRNLVVAAVLLAMLLAALDQTIVSTALPTMVAELGGGAHLSWVVTSYLLAETVMTVLIGGESATASGLWMLPLIAGLMATALLTGNVISRTGRYRIFPLVGSAGLAAGLLLCPIWTPTRVTGSWARS